MAFEAAPRRAVFCGRSEGSPPTGAVPRAASLYPVGPEDPNHDAAMRISGEAPGRRTQSHGRRKGHAITRDPATSNRSGTRLRLAERVPNVLVQLANHAHDAGRKATPSGGAPVVANCHRAIRSLRASATIMVLRVPRAV